MTKGYTAIVDSEDYEYLSTYRWYAHSSGNYTYAARKDKNRKIIFMHKEITKNEGIVKHKNNNTLDNRKQNLYLNGNLMNRIKNDMRIYFNERTQKYIARLSIHIGSYETSQEAQTACDTKIRELEKA